MLRKSRGVINAGIVDEHLDTAVGTADLFEHAAHGGTICDVGEASGQATLLARCVAGQLVEIRAVDVDGMNIKAVVEHALDDGAADAAVAASDKRELRRGTASCNRRRKRCGRYRGCG